MPCIDFRCGCCGSQYEAFFHPSQVSDEMQMECRNCGRPGAERIFPVRAPAVVWTGPITSRYRDKDKDGFHGPSGNGDGMIQYTRNTPDGKPKPVHLESWSDVKSFCKREGLVDPRQMGRNMVVSEDGKSMKADMGAKGTEV